MKTNVIEMKTKEEMTMNNTTEMKTKEEMTMIANEMSKEYYEKDLFRNIVKETYLDLIDPSICKNLSESDKEYLNIITSVKSSLENNETISFDDVTDLLRCVTLKLERPLMTEKEIIKSAVLNNIKCNLKVAISNQESIQKEQQFMQSYLFKELSKNTTLPMYYYFCNSEK